MIYTRMEHIDRYLGQSETLDTAIRYLKQADLTKLALGRNEVDGDNVYVNRFEYDTVPKEQAIWEGHLQYADVHLVLSGEERIGVAAISRLTETNRDVEADFVGFEGAVETWCVLRPGDLLVVFPEDIHMVKVQSGPDTHVEKVVFKVRA